MRYRATGPGLTGATALLQDSGLVIEVNRSVAENHDWPIRSAWPALPVTVHNPGIDPADSAAGAVSMTNC
jgi:hypothetical protein